MAGEPEASRYRRWFGVYLLVVSAIATAYGVLHARHPNGWVIGEWAINYSAGFVRRGLPGEIILLLQKTSGVGLPWIAFAMQEAAYVIFVGCVYLLTRGMRWGWMVAALLLSPATLAFLVLDPPVGFKKEILLFAALAVLICVLLSGKLRDWQIALLLSVGCAGLVLSHESLLAYLPYLFAAVAVRAGGMRALRIAAAPVLASAAAAAAVVWRPGNLRTAEAICASVGGRLSAFGVTDDRICGGEILWLQENFAQAHDAVAKSVRVHHDFRLYLPLAVLALAPALAALANLYRAHGMRRGVKLVGACSMAAMLGSLLLFYSGRDWGRWIHIHAVCLMLLVVMLSRAEGVAGLRSRPSPRGAKRWIAVCALGLYATCWTLPAVDIYPARAGYLGLYRYLRSYGPSHRGSNSMEQINTTAETSGRR